MSSIITALFAGAAGATHAKQRERDRDRTGRTHTSSGGLPVVLSDFEHAVYLTKSSEAKADTKVSVLQACVDSIGRKRAFLKSATEESVN